MQLRGLWGVAALAGALLCGACSKEQASAQAPASKPQPQKKAEAPAQPATEPAAEAPTPSEEAQAAAPAEDDNSPPPEFKIGQTRDEVMSLFGNCAERRAFVPPGPGALYVEIYQAKEDERCRKRLGERHFTIRGGTLYAITPGLIPPEPPPKERPAEEGI